MSDAPLVPRVEAEPCETGEVPPVAPLPAKPAPKPNPAPDSKTTGKDIEPVGQRPMDWTDLQARLKKTEESLKTLSMAHDELQSQAYALLWFVPDDVTVGSIQELKKRFKESFQRAHDLEAENAALRQDAQGVVRDTANAIVTRVNPERRKVTKVAKTAKGYSGPGEVVVEFRTKAGEPRFVVAHQIAEGEGEFFHIYSEREIEE